MSASASKSALLLSPCLRWAWEGAKRYDDRFTDTTKRDKGTLFHDMTDAHIKKVPLGLIASTPQAPPDVAKWFQLATDWYHKHLEPRCVEVHSEVYVASNFSTDKVHVDPEVRNRKYPDMPGYLPGTTDLVCVLSTGELLVADWKTGGGTGADKQLMSLAWGLRHVYRMASTGLVRPVRLAILYVSDDGVHPVEWAVTEEELVEHGRAMSFQLMDVGVRTEPVVGIHCSQLYCDHLAHCPGIGAIAMDASEGKEGLLPAQSLVRKFRMTDKPTSAEEAGFVMERVTAAKRQLKYYEESIRRYIEDGGRAVSGDFEYSKKADGHRWRTIK